MFHASPPISAIIPTYNRSQYLPRALDSVLAQSHPPAEIIVIDDGSDDDTADLVRGYGERVRYTYQPNAGPSNARNNGAKTASSPWIAFLDADDYWTGDHLQRMAGAIEETDGAADVYFSDIMIVGPELDGEFSLWETAGFSPDGPYTLVEDGSDWALMPRQPFRVQGSVFRRERYVAAGGQHEQMRIREDQHLYLKLGCGRPMCAVSGIAAYYTREADNQLTKRYRGRSWGDAYVEMYADLLQRGDLPAHARAVLRARYGNASYALVPYDLRERKFGPLCANLARGLRYNPTGLLDKLRR